MYRVELYARVRRAVLVEGRSEREVAREYGLARETVRKMLRHSIPPGYRRKEPPKRPRLGPWMGVIDAILEQDQQQPAKQRHTAKRIFDRLRVEHGFTGGYTIVKDYVRLCRQRSQEVFVPLTHAPGTAQVDFGQAVAVVAGEECTAHFFVYDNQIPLSLGKSRGNIVLLCKIHRSDDQRLLLPNIAPPCCIHHAPIYRRESLAETFLHFAEPLVFQVTRYDHKRPLNQSPVLEFLEQKPGHDGLSRTRIVSEEKPEAWVPQNVVVDGFNLVWQRVYLRHVDCVQGVELIGESNPVSLDS